MSVAIDDFVRNLTDSGLMSADEVTAFKSTLPAPPKDGETLAKSLVQANKLTKYQAAAIFQGKTSHLVLGDYVVLDKLGQGGMGQVLKARHARMDRLVAVKILPSNRIDSAQAVKRFHQEVRAAAQLIHPNIVTAFDAGEKGRIHYLVMECVNGDDLSTIIKDQGPIPIEKSVKYIIQAAEGLKYAHEKGIIHRDIKPSNLLLSKEGAVKILDMGLARLSSDQIGNDPSSSDEQLTQSGQVMGTADFMAPEQALDTRQADARSDVYSLGCTLYRLLTGEVPFDADTLMLKVMAHQQNEIPDLREKRPDVPERLVAVFRKMLQKDPADRPQSMAAVIDALQACLSTASPSAPSVPRPQAHPLDPPELAKQPSKAMPRPAPPPSTPSGARRPAPLQRESKESSSRVVAAAPVPKESHSHEHLTSKPSRPPWVVPSIIGGGVVAVFVVIAILIAIFRSPNDPSDVVLATEGTDGGTAIAGGDASAPAETNGKGNSNNATDGNLGKTNWSLAESNPVRRLGEAKFCHGAFVREIAVSPDEKTIVTRGDNKRLRFWDAASGEERFSFRHTENLWSMAYLPDGSQLFASDGHGQILKIDTTTGKATHGPKFDLGVQVMCATDDGRVLGAYKHFMHIRVLDISAGTELFNIELEKNDPSFGEGITFSPSGDVFAFYLGTSLEIWGVQAKSHLRSFNVGGHWPRHVVQFSEVGNRVVTEFRRDIRVWDYVTGDEVARLAGPRNVSISSLAVSPNGKQIAAGALDYHIHLWDVETRAASKISPEETIHVLEFVEDGKKLLGVGFGYTIRQWDAMSHDEILMHDSLPPRGPVLALAVSPDNKTLAAAHRYGLVRFWNAADGKHISDARHPPRPPKSREANVKSNFLIFSKKDGRLLSGSSNRRPGLNIWDPKTGERAEQIDDVHLSVYTMALSRDENLLALGGGGTIVKLFDWRNRVELPEIGPFESKHVRAISFSPDGKFMATVEFNAVKIWDLETRRVVDQFLIRDTQGVDVAFAPDSKTLILGTILIHQEKPVSELTTENGLYTIRQHVASSIRFSPVGDSYAIARHDGSVQIWKADSPKVITVFRDHEDAVQALAFSPDGRFLASAGDNATIAVRQLR